MPALLVDPRRAPTYYIKVIRKGQGKSERVDVATTRVTNLNFTAHEKQASKIKLSVDNRDLSNLENPLFATGNVLEVSFGYPGNMMPARRATITKVLGSLVLRVEAVSQAAMMNRIQRVRTFDNMRRSDVAAIIGGEQGFAGSYLDVEETKVTLPHIPQSRMTDATLLRQMAQKEGFEFYIDGTGFHWHRRRLGKKPLRLFTYFVDPGQGDIVSWEIDSDIFARPASVTHKGIDPLTNGKIDETADANSTSHIPGISAARPDLSIDPKTGEGTRVSWLESESAALVASTAKTKEDAAAQAAGAFNKTALSMVRLTIVAVGDPLVMEATMIRIEGIGSVLSGNYHVVEADHKPTVGYTMTLKVIRDGLNNGTPAKAKANDKDAPSDGSALVPYKVVSAIGEEHTEYHPLGWTKGT